MNDVDNEVISRDIVLLDVITHIDPDNISDIEFLWDVWYNMTLTPTHYHRLKVTLKRLLDDATNSSQRWSFGDHVTEKQVCNVCYVNIHNCPKPKRTILCFQLFMVALPSQWGSDHCIFALFLLSEPRRRVPKSHSSCCCCCCCCCCCYQFSKNP